MILEVLNRHYEDLLDKGEIAQPGWGAVKVSYALCLNQFGELEWVKPLVKEKTTENETSLVPQIMHLPILMGKRTSGIQPNFLWDNSKYLLGIYDKDIDKFSASKKFHVNLLKDIDTVAARAICLFFKRWNPIEGKNHFALSSCLDRICSGGNLVFCINGKYAQEDLQIKHAWEDYFERKESTRKEIQCLVTGKKEVPVAVHPVISGVDGSLSSGSTLVSFNADAFCSYGKKKCLNAPISKQAAFAYTSALNHLLADRENRQRIGNTIFIYWAEGADPLYQNFLNSVLFDTKPPDAPLEADISPIVKENVGGVPYKEWNLNPDKRFYILGIAPNASRLSVHFFYNDTFGALIKNIKIHQEEIEIVGPSFDLRQNITFWALLGATINKKDKSYDTVFARDFIGAIFTGSLYPVSLLKATMRSIRIQQDVSRGKAAIIKAYYLRNPNKNCPEEVLTVALNESSTNIPYILGRLFFMYETVQIRAFPNFSRTIKSKYFYTASLRPATIFPTLSKLNQNHMCRLNTSSRNFFEQQIMQLKESIGEEYPPLLSLPQQGAFDLGYYHQKQHWFTIKGEVYNNEYN